MKTYMMILKILFAAEIIIGTALILTAHNAHNIIGYAARAGVGVGVMLTAFWLWIITELHEQDNNEEDKNDKDR